MTLAEWTVLNAVSICTDVRPEQIRLTATIFTKSLFDEILAILQSVDFVRACEGRLTLTEAGRLILKGGIPDAFGGV